MSTQGNWFYIRSVQSGHVISVLSNEQEYVRSQVIVTLPTLNDFELWKWQGEFLVNKATGLVLDIRKGRLRLIEDTEICLYYPKPLEEAHNQLWAIKDHDFNGNTFYGAYIYSVCSNEWILNVQPWKENIQKLVLFPLQPIEDDNQRWIFVPEGQLNLNVPFQSTESITPSDSISSLDYSQDFPKGLSPAKRGSHPSIFSMEVCKDYHHRVYDLNDNHVSDKGLAMATAYHIFQNWKLDQMSNNIMTDFPHSSPNETRYRLQLLTQNEATKLLKDKQMESNNNIDSVLAISSRLIAQFYDQTPISP